MEILNITYSFHSVVEAVGCFKDQSARALPELVESFRGKIDWYHMDNTIADCANVIQEKGYKVCVRCGVVWDEVESIHPI